MGDKPKEFKANAGLFAIVGTGLAVAGGLVYMNNQLHEDFTQAAQDYDAFMICVATRTPAANANLVVYVPVEAQIQDAGKQSIKEKMQHVVRNFSVDDYKRNVPALDAQAGATMLGLSRELGTTIQIHRGPVTSVCPP